MGVPWAHGVPRSLDCPPCPLSCLPGSGRSPLCSISCALGYGPQEAGAPIPGLSPSGRPSGPVGLWASPCSSPTRLQLAMPDISSPLLGPLVPTRGRPGGRRVSGVQTLPLWNVLVLWGCFHSHGTRGYPRPGSSFACGALRGLSPRLPHASPHQNSPLPRPSWLWGPLFHPITPSSPQSFHLVSGIGTRASIPAVGPPATPPLPPREADQACQPLPPAAWSFSAR